MKPKSSVHWKLCDQFLSDASSSRCISFARGYGVPSSLASLWLMRWCFDLADLTVAMLLAVFMKGQTFPHTKAGYETRSLSGTWYCAPPGVTGLRPRWSWVLAVWVPWYLAPTGETPVPTAVVMRYRVLRSSGSGTGSGLGAKFDSTPNLTRPGLFPFFGVGGGGEEALLAGPCQLSQFGFTSAQGFWLSSALAHIVPLELKGTLG